MKSISKIPGDVFVDDRGIIRYANQFDFNGVKRFYQVENHSKGTIRAWHGHKKEGKYVYVVHGSAWIGIIDMETGDVSTYVLSASKPSVLYIPPENYNGFKTLENDTIVMFFSTSTLEESKGDDYRKPYGIYPIFEEEIR